MKRMKLFLALAGVTVTIMFLAAPCGSAYLMVWETNSFTADEGNWTYQQNNYANGNNVGWVNSSLAGGTAGELGGRVDDSATQTAFIFRPLDYTIDISHEMHLRGSVMLTNTEQWPFGSGEDINVWVGYFNSSDSDNMRMGWRTYTPASSGATQPLRGRARINNGSNQSQIPMNQGQIYDFEAWWQPTGGGLGTFSGNIGSTTWNVPNYNAGTGTYDVFGLIWTSDNSPAGTLLNYYVYFDNLEYLVPIIPEPPAVWLGGLGLAALGVVQRLRAARRR